MLVALGTFIYMADFVVGLMNSDFSSEGRVHTHSLGNRNHIL